MAAFVRNKLMMMIDALDELCAQLTRDLFAIAKFLLLSSMFAFSVPFSAAKRLPSTRLTVYC